ncbi:MAG: hypothetical protein ACLS6G_08330, partial [Christensenellales bacterium]
MIFKQMKRWMTLFIRLRRSGHAAERERGITLFGVGISTAAIVDYGNGNLYENRFNKAWPSNYPMAQRMREIFGNDAIIYVENAGKAAGRALLLHGSDSRDYRILTVFFDEGISSCMIEYGHVLNGSFSLIGEIGRIRSDQMLLE